MKAQNKSFSILVTLVLLTNIFVPNFVLADEQTPAPEIPIAEPVSAEPAPAEETPVAPPEPEPAPEAPAAPVGPSEPSTPSIPATDTTAPVITIIGNNPYILTVGETYIESGATAVDETDGILFPSSQAASVSTTLVGTYTVGYLVSDAAGNQGSAFRTVTVNQASTEPPADDLTNEDNTGAGADPASTAPDIVIRLNILTPDEVISADTIVVSPCKVTPESELTLSVYCALKGLSDRTGWSLVTTQFGSSLFLQEFKSYAGDGFNNYWLWFHDNELGNVGINEHLLTPNETIMFTYGAFPLKTEINPSQPVVGNTTTISVYQFGFDEQNGWAATWSLAGNSTVTLNDVDHEANSGNFEFTPQSPENSWVLAKKAGFLSSSIKGFTPTLPTTPIRLNIQTSEGEFFNQELTVTACRNNTTLIYTLNAWCALNEAASIHRWTVRGTDWGTGIFLDQINEYASDFDNFKFWNWYHDLQMGTEALDHYQLTAGQELLFAYAINPIKLEVSSTTPTVGSSITVTISEQNFSSTNFPPPWIPLTTTSTLYVNGEAVTIPAGTYEFAVTGTTTLRATKANYLGTAEITVTPGEVAAARTTDTPSSSGSGATNQTNAFDISAAANYLLNKQNPNGSIGSHPLYSDWAAIAIGSLGNSSAKSGLSAYLKTDPTVGDSATEYERRAMALMALGINPYSEAKTDYIAKIMGTYKDNQFGDAGLVNDDIFALFPLLKAGYSADDTEIKNSVAFIVSKQNSAGGWDSPDMTAAAVQALSQVKSLNGVTEALVKAKNYLKLSTKADGRIGDNSFSTSWGSQALSALGESVTTWNGSNPTPLNYLASQQQSDGGVDQTTASSDNRVWSTSYAIPAAQGKTWDSILVSFNKPSSAGNSNGSSLTATTTPSTVTSTTNIVTSTPSIVTSTEALIITAPEVTAPQPIISVENNEAAVPVIPVPVTAPSNQNSAPTLANNLKENIPEPENKIVTANSNNSGEQLTVPTQNTVNTNEKALFGGAAALAGSAGAYLAWRFFQGLV